VKSSVRILVCAGFFINPIGVCCQCKNGSIRQSQGDVTFVAPEYSSQIQLARRAAIEIYDHGMVGNSGSAINNEVAWPPGISIAVAVDGKIVWAEGFGFADIEQCVPVTPRTKFRIGSTSKPLTAAGAALLYDQGRIDFDAPIQRYVPAFPDKGYVTTMRQLLGILAEFVATTQRKVTNWIATSIALWAIRSIDSRMTLS
jgi:beta-lactamase family protein